MRLAIENRRGAEPRALRRDSGRLRAPVAAGPGADVDVGRSRLRQPRRRCRHPATCSPDEPGSTAEKVALRVAIVLLLLFPYLLYRFASAFEPEQRPLGALRRLAQPHPRGCDGRAAVPACGRRSWPWWFVRLRARLPRPLVGAAAVGRDPALARGQVGGDRRPAADADARTRLDRAGRDAARERRRGRRPLVVRAHSRLLGSVSAAGFLLGFAPPAVLRLLWRRPEQSRMQLAVGELMGATTEQDAAARVLPPMAEMVGARGIVLEGLDGSVVAEHRTGEDDPNGDVRRLTSRSARSSSGRARSHRSSATRSASSSTRWAR